MRQRKHIRLSGFDYSSTNTYFITICVKNFEHLLGEVRNGIMGLSDIGNTASLLLQEMPEERPNIILDEFMIMPNHLHCILDLTRKNSSDYKFNQFAKPVCDSVSMLINHYKGSVKKWCNNNAFGQFEWQCRFHDHVIRNDLEYFNIKRYIRENPKNWKDDCFFSRDMPAACPSKRHVGKI
ncbi:MAG: transposase [Flavisolibacter sp.]